MYQNTNGMGVPGGTLQGMPAPMIPGNAGNWNRQMMGQTGGAGAYANNWQSAGEMFADMPGSMNSNMMGGMSGMPGMSDMSGNMAAGAMDHSAHTATPMEGNMRRLDLDTGLTQDQIENPTSLLEARLGSLRALLSKLVGHYVIATFLVGTQSPVSWEGFLYSVGNDYIVIFQPDNNRYVTGDMFSIKFVEFYEEKGVIPGCVGMRRRDGQNMW